ncbi:VWA domain-containing protein [Synechocystis sp. PCC 7339]|uniref:vWA domain-containing protein n=1 Tax=unclassified Synechocystis TaxID=2640012 RepID=UPI001BAF759F|nr:MULTISPECIES: VWA domain-containing protein [unclassified Synechocystis]QUS60050.1 VWA domain-containing protein [Synechocystis sp. PCC 7338]UAJ72501.1 VWA domain-containing protein [Synechocystis sp. PCC 7339]
MPIGVAEFMENQENRCPVVLVLDTSGSMQGAPIRALNEGIKTFQQDVLRDTQAMLSVETAVVTFGNGGVQTVQDFVGIDRFSPPILEAGDLTPMGEAIELALDLVEDRKAVYKSHGIQYYRPWVFLITDGAPTDQWLNAAQRVQQAEAANRLLFFSVGVQGADMAKLRQISNNPPVLLNGLDFRDLFQWLSSSMKRVSGSKVGESIALPPVSWGQITT